ncbi:hypothetical protein [Synechococcus sp. R6-7]|uniref:hypothetical protein n=1 Tax=Synechococcus sp. R6-7 TaxID=2291958 RepID=UPI0039C280DE
MLHVGFYFFLYLGIPAWILPVTSLTRMFLFDIPLAYGGGQLVAWVEFSWPPGWLTWE